MLILSGSVLQPYSVLNLTPGTKLIEYPCLGMFYLRTGLVSSYHWPNSSTRGRRPQIQKQSFNVLLNIICLAFYLHLRVCRDPSDMKREKTFRHL